MTTIPTHSDVLDAFLGANVVQPKELQKNLENAGWHVNAAIAAIENAVRDGVVEQSASGGLRAASKHP